MSPGTAFLRRNAVPFVPNRFWHIKVYTMQSGFMTIYGVVYLLSLGLAFAITIQMRQTIEA